MIVEEFCHILFEKTTMWAYQNIALAMISAKSEHITPLGGRRGVDGGGGGPTLPNVLFRVSRRCRATPRGQHICAHHHHHRHQHHPLATRTRRTERVREGSTHLCTANPERLTTYLPMAYSRFYQRITFILHEPINHFSDFITSSIRYLT